MSSSGHLVLVQRILKIDGAFEFDVLLNFGTLLALLIYFRKRIWHIVYRTLWHRDWIFAAKLSVATLPVIFIGYVGSDFFRSINDNTWLVVAALAIIGFGMVRIRAPRTVSGEPLHIYDVDWQKVAIIGVAQSLALIPGVSRSGITILTGMALGLPASVAAEFSFLLALPTILGASLKVLASGSGIDFIQQNMTAFWVGNLWSFGAGFAAIGVLLALIRNRGLRPFGYYRLTLAALLAILLTLRII